MKRSSWVLVLTLAAAATHACRAEREWADGDSFHDPGFAEPGGDDFHGTYLKTRGYPLAKCRDCHGDDYHGGSVGVSCSGAGCHTNGVEACDTCHDAEPSSGAHRAHHEEGFGCEDCHEQPEDARSVAHPNGEVTFHFAGLAVSGDHHPAFDATTRSCKDAYCHGGHEVEWEKEGPLPCSSCHDDPPSGHGRFATAASDCASCHGDPEIVHVDGDFDIATFSCSDCHGKGPLGAPPAGLVLDPTGPGVGAHARHLDATLADRIGRVSQCDDCHRVPDEVTSPGHLDGAAPADVALRFGGSYTAATMTCTVGCHWDRAPGPRWDDDSGDARACDACHSMPPERTRTGTAHPPSEPELGACLGCHRFDPASHVDGKVDFAWDP